MALPISAISEACRWVREFLRAGLNTGGNSVSVLIGSPADAAPKQGDDDHRVNLFFYTLEPSGFGFGQTPRESWWVRLQCLVTPFAVAEEQISSGENDLRLLGETVRLFHETPILAARDIDGETVRLQVVPNPMKAEDVNHIWSTQGDVAYRPSVMYEIAVTPVVPSERETGSPLVSATGLEVRATEEARTAAFTGAAAPPPVVAGTVDTARADWAPRVCFVNGGVCSLTLSFELTDPALVGFEPAVWVAGDPAESVTLRWEIWDEAGGWRSGVPTATVNPIGPGIDPAMPPGPGDLATIALPFADRVGQMVLSAVRTYRLEGDTRDREAWSDLLVVNLYEAGP